jgi:dTDP-4-amino-4,6-dideoxygalactose transaminase
MNNVIYPLACSSWDQKELDAMQRVISTGSYSMGTEVRLFEEQFADYFGKKYAIMANSGSSANLLMIAALFFKKQNPLKAGDEVIVPAISWSTTYTPLQQYGLKVKFVDIDLDTLNFDLVALESAISDKTKAILAVNLLGNPNDFNRIKDIINTREIILLEDNCESMGAEFDSEKAGSIGLMGSFSTFFSHHISTMEGGLVITDDEELYHIMLSLRAHGWTRNLPDNNFVSGEKSKNPFDESFKFVLPGYNLRPLEFSGAIGQEQLVKLERFVKERRKNADIFNKLISKIQGIRIQKELGKSSYFGFSIILDENIGISRDMVVSQLISKGIECRPIVTGNFTKNPTIKYFNYTIHNNLINADNADKNGFFVGNHHYNLEKEIEYFGNVLKNMLNK